MPSALAALGLEIPRGLDGTSFLGSAPSGSDGHLARERSDNDRGAESAVA